MPAHSVHGKKAIEAPPAAGREAEYKAGVHRVMQYAEVLACPRIHSMAGVLPAGVSREDAQATLVANLK